jgi:hypothetical protein
MNKTFHYCYRRAKGTRMLTSSISGKDFFEVVEIIKDCSTDTVEIIYIIPVPDEA